MIIVLVTIGRNQRANWDSLRFKSEVENQSRILTDVDIGEVSMRATSRVPVSVVSLPFPNSLTWNTKESLHMKTQNRLLEPPSASCVNEHSFRCQQSEDTGQFLLNQSFMINQSTPFVLLSHVLNTFYIGFIVTCQ